MTVINYTDYTALSQAAYDDGGSDVGRAAFKDFLEENEGDLCQCEEAVGRHRSINTQYVDEHRNYVYACDKCHEEICEHYADLWASIR